MMASLDRHLGCVQTDTTLLFSQQLPTFLLFRDRRSAAQPRWIRLHSSSNIVGATNAHYAWFTKTYGLYPSHDALQVPTLLEVVASVCRPLPTRTQQLPTVLRQQCWELGVRLHAALKNKGCTLSIVRDRKFSSSKRPNKARQVSEEEKEILWKSWKLGGNNPESFIQTDWTSIPWTVQPVSAACKL